MIEIMMCSRRATLTLTLTLTLLCSIFNVKMKNCCRSTLTQYGVAQLYLLESVASNSPEQLREFKVKTPERYKILWSVSGTRRSPQWLKHTIVIVTKTE